MMVDTAKCNILILFIMTMTLIQGQRGVGKQAYLPSISKLSIDLDGLGMVMRFVSLMNLILILSHRLFHGENYSYSKS